MVIQKDQFEFVEPPKKWLRNGKPEVLYPGSRWYIEKGYAQQLHHWIKELNVNPEEPVIPLQWAPDIIGVSRTALLKRAKAGGLTVMSYQIVSYSKTVLGGVKDRDTKSRYDYVYLSECEQWKSELLHRASKRERR
jgi:hypothetical protein